jgi:hypothetical protein
MSRQPAHILAKTGHYSPRQMIWQAVRKFGCFTVSDIVEELGGNFSLDQVREYLSGLTNAAYLEVSKPENKKPPSKGLSINNIPLFYFS